MFNLFLAFEEKISLKTNILYSNIQNKQYYKPIITNNLERLKRPSSLSKALIPSAPNIPEQKLNNNQIVDKYGQHLTGEHYEQKPSIESNLDDTSSNVSKMPQNIIKYNQPNRIKGSSIQVEDEALCNKFVQDYQEPSEEKNQSISYPLIHNGSEESLLLTFIFLNKL